MTAPRILLFDSGMGGLTVAASVREQLPDAHLIYSADNAGFPYGAWKEEALVARIVQVVGTLIEASKPDIVVIACNTASTLAMATLGKNSRFPLSARFRQSSLRRRRRNQTSLACWPLPAR